MSSRTLGALLGCLAALLVPAAANAAVTTFGSPLSVPATLNTSENLNYTGTGIQVGESLMTIHHDGADTALWNVALPEGSPTAPAAGQVTKFSLEGCAQRPRGAPAPLTQIHFQDLSPLSGGGALVNSTSQSFEIPVCGENGAGPSTVTSYVPINFCVAQGDYVDFNDEGGFVPGENGGLSPYPSGVPFEVIGEVKEAVMDSFIRGNGTNNGQTFSPSDTSYHDGFATNRNEELLQATLATGTDASSSCGGTQVPVGTSKPPPKPLPPLRVGKQTDGINSHRIASVAIYCRPATGCKGQLTLAAGVARQARTITTSFALAGGKTSHVSVRVPNALVKLARKHRHTGVSMKLTAVVEGQTFTQTVTLRIF